MSAVADGQDRDRTSSGATSKAQLGALGLQGHIDALESGRVYGWAWNPELPDERLSVDVYRQDELLGTVMADRFRQDLRDCQVGDGRHAFVYDLPPALRGSTDPAAIAVYFSDSQIPLSRGGDNQSPLAGPSGDPETTVSHRMDRVEASLQQLFGVLGTLRRDGIGGTQQRTQDIQAVRSRLAAMVRADHSLEQRLGECEKSVNAVQAFIQRFELEIFDRVHRNELDELRRAQARKPGWAGLAAGLVVTLLAAIAMRVL